MLKRSQLTVVAVALLLVTAGCSGLQGGSNGAPSGDSNSGSGNGGGDTFPVQVDCSQSNPYSEAALERTLPAAPDGWSATSQAATIQLSGGVDPEQEASQAYAAPNGATLTLRLKQYSTAEVATQEASNASAIASKAAVTGRTAVLIFGGDAENESVLTLLDAAQCVSEDDVVTLFGSSGSGEDEEIVEQEGTVVDDLELVNQTDEALPSAYVRASGTFPDMAYNVSIEQDGTVIESRRVFPEGNSEQFTVQLRLDSRLEAGPYEIVLRQTGRRENEVLAQETVTVEDTSTPEGA